MTFVIGSEIPQETRYIHKRVDVQASLADVWSAWTTVKGVNSFFPFEWAIPRHFPEVRKNANQPWNRTWVVVFFGAVGEAQTEVEVYHMELGVGDQWDRVYHFFDRNWDAILERLNQSFAEAR
ncbi:MAG: hypothetical protein ACE5IY_22910 [bacterium]